MSGRALIALMLTDPVEPALAPAGYPLPWCEVLGLAYWRVNLLLCSCEPGWPARQRGRAMADIITWIDAMIAEVRDPARAA